MDGNALVWCDGAYGTPNGKTAHGLVRHTRRYNVLGVIDARHAGRDAGEVLDGRERGVPVYATLDDGLAGARAGGHAATHLVVGLAPDGGRLPPAGREVVAAALRAGLHVDCGLHDFLSDDAELVELAARAGVRLRDVRKPPPRSEMHFFSGKIDTVDAPRVAVLGTDSAVGKRTTAILLTETLRARGYAVEMIGTGQTAWMQGVRYGVILDSLVNDFVSGEIEHAIWRAAEEARPDAMVLEGQGSLLNPAYPGGFELIAAGRPRAIVLQHAPARTAYDGFPDVPLHPIERQIDALELIADRPVVAVTLNHEGLANDEVPAVAASLARQVGRPVFDVLLEGAEGLADVVRKALGLAEPRR
jgi:uncharacterized NAD-dependent epimerase/dehydratase family protein